MPYFNIIFNHADTNMDTKVYVFDFPINFIIKSFYSFLKLKNKGVEYEKIIINKSSLFIT